MQDIQHVNPTSSKSLPVTPYQGMDFVVNPPVILPCLDFNMLFPKVQPLEVEVGCGKGRFLLNKSLANPGINFIGIERMMERVRKVAKKLDRAKSANVRILRMDAVYVVQRLLPAGSVSAFYFFFPDPWPKRRHESNRLFSAGFLNDLARTLTKEGRINIATDHLEYHEAIVKLFLKDVRFKQVDAYVTSEAERTEFETIFIGQGKPIGRSSFVLA